MSKQQLFINGKWQAGQGAIFTSENPCTGEIIWTGQAASGKDVDCAVQSAREALAEWSLHPFDTRVKYLRSYQAVLEKNRKALATAVTEETGKPLWESLGEIGTMISKVDLSIDAYLNRCAESSKAIGEATSTIRYKPHGVMAVFGPYNFPGHLPNGHIVPALLAGNTVVYKPSELTPKVAELMLSFMESAGIPSGVINLLQGAKDTGISLAQHPQIDGLLFTGSSATGQALHKQFGGDTGKILALEMGGNNPLVIDHCKDIKAAVYHTLQSAFITAGQRCTCARRLIVINSSTSESFLEQLCDAIRHIVVGAPGDEPEAFIGPVISNEAAEHMLSSQESLQRLGGETLVPMQRIQPDKPFLSPGLIDLSQIKNRPDEEYFGPLLQLIRVNTLEDAIAEANNTRFGLAAGIFTDSKQRWEEFYRLSRAGIVNWNRPLTGASGSAPFGGTGASGNHRPSAYFAADYSAYPVASLEQEELYLPETLACGITL